MIYRGTTYYYGMISLAPKGRMLALQVIGLCNR